MAKTANVGQLHQQPQQPQQRGRRPPSFKECPICRREFGSRSLQFHLAKCAEKHDHNNNNGSKKRKKHDTISTSTSNSSSSSDEVETSLSDELSNSWPSKRMTNVRHRRLDRPRTAVLRKPIVLDESLKNKVDMTLTKKQFLAAFKLCSGEAINKSNNNHNKRPQLRNRRAPVGYNRDIVHLQYQGVRGRPPKISEPENTTKIPVAKDTSPVRAVGGNHRPTTTRLGKPTNDLSDLPRILPNPQNKVKQKAKVTKANSSESGVLEPCRSCGRTDLPERFHTHPPVGSEAESPKKAPAAKNNTSPKKAVKSNEKPKAKSRSSSPKKKKPSGSGNGFSDSEVILAKEQQPSPEAKTEVKSETKCSTCGKDFGKASLRFHEPQCRKKHDAIKALEEQRRREAEQAQSYATEEYAFDDGADADGSEFNGTFDAIWEAHVQQLTPCAKCGRTFFPDRIGIHEKSCKGKIVNNASMVNLQSANSNANAKSAAASMINLQQTSPSKSVRDLVSRLDLDLNGVEVDDNDHVVVE